MNAISFADFLYAKGAFMTELKMVQCKFFNVIMKKASTVEVETVGDGTLDNDTILEETIVRRLLISLDLRYLHPAATEEGPLANEETIKYARSKADAVENELMGLKERFEEVFEDDEKAVEEGKCRLLDERDYSQWNGTVFEEIGIGLSGKMELPRIHLRQVWAWSRLRVSVDRRYVRLHSSISPQ